MRETFSSRFGIAMTMIGVALGLGNIWRFPYLVGRYGGAAFVLAYLLIVLLIAVPALCLLPWLRPQIRAAEESGLAASTPKG